MKRAEASETAEPAQAELEGGPSGPVAAPARAGGEEPWARILSSVQAPTSTPLPALTLARVACVEEGGEVVLILGGRQTPARLDHGVHPLVIKNAQARGERVLVEVDASGAAVVVGALRTRPTPGVDAAEEYTIEAERVAIRGGEEVAISARAASVVLRALGEVETYADRILSRAEGVHKIVGRMLRLN